jgi:hypothetical protein
MDWDMRISEDERVKRHKESMKKYRKTHVESVKEYNRLYRDKFRIETRISCLASTYKISKEKVEEIIFSPCGICKKGLVSEIDHNHRTGEIRGPLCRKHNLLVGLMEELSIEEFLKILEWLEW